MHGDQADTVTVSVANQGPPIPPERLGGIFDAMKGESDGGDRRHLGLGLYIVDKIVDAHGGKIDLRSSEREGTTVTVSPSACLHLVRERQLAREFADGFSRGNWKMRQLELRIDAVRCYQERRQPGGKKERDSPASESLLPRPRGERMPQMIVIDTKPRTWIVAEQVTAIQDVGTDYCHVYLVGREEPLMLQIPAEQLVEKLAKPGLR